MFNIIHEELPLLLSDFARRIIPTSSFHKYKRIFLFLSFRIPSYILSSSSGSFSRKWSLGRTLSDVARRAILKLDLFPGVKFSLFLSSLEPRDFSLPQLYRIVARIGSHTDRLFRNRRAPTTPFYTCATAISRLTLLSISLRSFLTPRDGEK